MKRAIGQRRHTGVCTGAWLGILAGLFLQSGVSASSLQLEDYAALPAMRLVDLSPTGDRIAFLGHENGRDRVIVVDLAAMDAVSEVAIDVEGLHELVLLDGGSVIGFSTRVQRSRNNRLYRYSAAFHIDGSAGTVAQLLDGFKGVFQRQASMGRVVGVTPDGQSVFMPAGYRAYGPRGASLALFEVNLATDEVTLREPGRPATVDWFVDEHGRVIAREDFDDQRDVHTLWAIGAAGASHELFRQETEVMALVVAGLSQDGQSLVVVGQGTVEDGTELYLLDLVGGGVRAAGLGRPNATIERVIMDLNRRVAGVSFAGLMPDYQFFDATLEARVAAIQDEFAHTAARLVDWSDDFRILLFHVAGSLSSGAYLVVDAASGRQWVGEQRPAINAPARVRIVRYPARDGLEIPALLTLPSGAEWPAGSGMAKWPLVVLPHGGPKDNDVLGFDWLAQYLADRGAVVLQPQFRGSTGQGIAFQQRGLGEWGGAMSTDLDDGVRFLVEQGLVDPERVCMVGSSYGGYAALAAGAFSEIPYRCLVSISGVSNLREMLRYERRKKGSASWNIDDLERQFGADSSDRRALEARSPVAFADRFRAPVLLLHGKDDMVVPPSQSEAMARALKRAGKPVELMLMSGEDHRLTQPETRLEALKRIDAFLREHLL